MNIFLSCSGESSQQVASSISSWIKQCLHAPEVWIATEMKVGIISFFILFSCTEKKTVPVISTSPVIEISYTSAISGGEITDEGRDAVTTKGVCWSTSPDPTVANNKTTENGSTLEFSSNLTGLDLNTKYYVRAWATNIAGTGYGNSITFTTKKAGVAILTTSVIASVTDSGAICGGSISDECGSSVSQRGVCWSIIAFPTTTDNKTSDGNGAGTFSSTLTGLKPGTTYYVRAYAVNNEGTVYGSELSFTTKAILAVLTTADAAGITPTSANITIQISDNGGATITERGICWSKSHNPVLTDNKTVSTATTDAFTTTASGLKGNTTYYARAYAINTAGVAYGNEITFITAPPVLPTLKTTISSITTNSVAAGGIISSDGGADIISRGVCWSSSIAPTIADSKTTDGEGAGTFNSSMTGLSLNTEYYVMAYATNSIGTSYGNQYRIKTYTGTITDVDGNSYFTVTIGTQIWMAENLNTKKFSNGDPIRTTSLATSNISAESNPLFQWAPDGNESNVAVYGRLYTGYAVIDNRNICPAGWHVPDENEWEVLKGYLSDNGYAYGGTPGSAYLAKSLASSSGWFINSQQYSFGTVGNDQSMNNSSGFNAYPAGIRYTHGEFCCLGGTASWWTATPFSLDPAQLHSVEIYYIGYDVSKSCHHKHEALSVRCLKN